MKKHIHIDWAGSKEPANPKISSKVLRHLIYWRLKVKLGRPPTADEMLDEMTKEMGYCEADRIDLFERAREKRYVGPAAAGEKRTMAAKEYWIPYQERYRQLIAAGKKPGEARKLVDYQIKKDKSWPPDYLKTKNAEPSRNAGPSWKVLEKWLK